MPDDAAHERAREVAEEAARIAEERARTEADRLRAAVEAGPLTKEMIRQQGVVYGALILIGVYMVQPFLTGPALDTSARICIIAFAVSIPFLAALVLVNQQEAFRGRRTSSRSVRITQVIAQGAALVGTVAGFWHITWIAGVAFLGAAFVAMLIHSAGWMRLEASHEPTPS
jgi:hypothetical protein